MKQRNTLPIWSIPFWIDLISVRIAFGLLSYCFAMEPTRKRSQVWDHFEMVPPNKVKCLLCSRHLAYNNNTSSVMRHYRAKHENEAGGAAVMTFPPVPNLKVRPPGEGQTPDTGPSWSMFIGVIVGLVVLFVLVVAIAAVVVYFKFKAVKGELAAASNKSTTVARTPDPEEQLGCLENQAPGPDGGV